MSAVAVLFDASPARLAVSRAPVMFLYSAVSAADAAFESSVRSAAACGFIA